MACNLALRFIYSAVSAAMGCLFGCFRVRSDNRCPPLTHLVSEPAVSRSRVSEASSSQAALYPLPPVKFHSEVSSSMANRFLTLRCTDGSMFEVDEEIAKQSKLLSNMIEDGCATDTIPIENITGTVLTDVLTYCKEHADYNKRVSGREVGEDDDEYIKMENFYYNMFGFEYISLLKQDLLAAHFLDIPDLEDKLIKTIATNIESKPVIFGIKNDFPPELELKLKEEYDKAFKPKTDSDDEEDGEFPDLLRSPRWRV